MFTCRPKSGEILMFVSKKMLNDVLASQSPIVLIVLVAARCQTNIKISPDLGPIEIAENKSGQRLLWRLNNETLQFSFALALWV